MGKKSKKTMWKTAAIIFGVLLLVGAGIGGYAWTIADDTNGGNGASGGSGSSDNSKCPDTGLTGFTLNAFNSVNTSSSEGVDMTVYLFDSDGVLTSTITDTTTPNDTNLDCDETYTAKAISTSGARGDPSVFDSVAGDAKIEDGNLVFTTKKANLDLRAQIERHASLNCRAKDNILGEFVYDAVDNSATDYETDGVTWMSSTSNTSKMDEADGFDMTFDCRAVEAGSDYNDRGVLVLLELPTTTWEIPSAYVNGIKLDELSLSGDEKDAYVDYEYAYLIPQDIEMEDGPDGFNVRVSSSLRSGVTSASADPQVDFAPRGAHLATDGQSVISDVAVTDASTPAQVHTLFDMTVDLT